MGIITINNIRTQAHVLSRHSYESEYWAFFLDDYKLQIVPTVLFAHACDHNNWSRTTKKVYVNIVQIFFRNIYLHSAKFKTLSNAEVKGFMQGYYLRKLPGQSNGPPISLERMKIVEQVLRELFKAGEELGFCERKKRNFTFKVLEGTNDKLDEVDVIYTNYISEKLFKELILNIVSKSQFENERDQLALHLGYESGLRGMELVRSDNFLLKRLYSAMIDYKIGEALEWKIIGKGKNGGKPRFILIKPSLAEKIFDFLDKYNSILNHCEFLFTQRQGTKLSSKYLTNIFTLIKFKLNDYELNHLTAHSLRHSYATNLANKCILRNMNFRIIQDRLGHSNSNTTELYIEVAHLINNRNSVT